jgi:maleate isomerase
LAGTDAGATLPAAGGQHGGTMRDVLGYRAKVGVVVPSTNTTMEPELYLMAPPGVTFHGARMLVGRPAVGSAAEARAFVEGMRAALDDAVRQVATLEPDHVLIGMSALSFMDGVEGHRRLKEALRDATAAAITTAAEAADAALRAYGVRRIGLLSPHPPLMDAHYHRFFAEAGYQVVAFRRIEVASSLAIAGVDEPTIRPMLVELAEAGVEAIVQVGTDLAMARLADEAERWLGTPVVAINAAMLWHALRARGIADRVAGFGALLREH